jgi:hypothetical protein
MISKQHSISEHLSSEKNAESGSSSHVIYIVVYGGVTVGLFLPSSFCPQENGKFTFRGERIDSHIITLGYSHRGQVVVAIRGRTYAGREAVEPKQKQVLQSVWERKHLLPQHLQASHDRHHHHGHRML